MTVDAIKAGHREDAIHALMNLWLKQPHRWCLNCEKVFDEISPVWPCCEKPYLTTNQLVFKRFIEHVKTERELAGNAYKSTPNKDMRHLLTFPPGLLQFLDSAMKRLYNEKLFTKEYDQRWFAKKFGKYFLASQEI